VAQFITKLGRAYDVPVVETSRWRGPWRPRLEVGKTIPADPFLAVAEVLAFVFRTRKRGLKALLVATVAPAGLATAGS
jgi:type III secretion system FlhB-like substrate exporter